MALHVTAGHQGMVKPLVVMTKVLYDTLINSAGSWLQQAAGHFS